jgi:hypothetical protein
MSGISVGQHGSPPHLLNSSRQRGTSLIRRPLPSVRSEREQSGSRNSARALNLKRHEMATHVIPKEPLKPQVAEPPKESDWTKPQAMAIPKEGYFKVEQGRYGPLFPTNAGLSRLHDHREDQAGNRRRNPAVRKKARECVGWRSLRARAAPASLSAMGPVRHRPRQVLHVPGNLRH